MIKQFLINPDGTIPDGVNVEMLIEAGIPLVVPTERWRPAAGFMLQEAEPEQDAEGIWRQRWIEVPAPPPEPELLPEDQV